MTTESPLNGLQEQFTKIDDKGTSAWAVLYQQIRSESVQFDYTLDEARKQQNKTLNRYRDVSPYDHSRVVLTSGICDYINASLVKMDSAHRKYILTQGPLPQTTGHFWLMVWEQKSKAVLMLNKIIEKNQIKCHQYWPCGKVNNGEDELIFEDVGFKVQFLSEAEVPGNIYITRDLRLTEMKSGEFRDVIQFHYTTWPDFGVPQSPLAFLKFLQHVRQSGALDENVGPPIVHCSAGIGRSGTFCLVDSCLVLFEEKATVNVKDILLELRKFRMGLIQTPDQLRFSYLAIIEGAKRILTKDTNGLDLIVDDSMKDYDEIEDEPPPLPTRGASLNHLQENGEEEIPVTKSNIPPDRPLPTLPPLPVGEDDNNEDEDDSDISTSDDEDESFKSPLITPPPQEESSPATELRKRKRNEQNERIAEQVRNMKRRQQDSEAWNKLKNAMIKPLAIGISVLVIGGGALLYRYYYVK